VFIDGVSGSEYVASNNRMINEYGIWKDVEGNDLDLIESSFRAFAAGYEKNHERPVGITFPVLDMNPGPQNMS
jgi:hypothetical protein